MAIHRNRHDPSKNFVGFIVGDVEYAVAIGRVKEIANPLEVVSCRMRRTRLSASPTTGGKWCP